MEITKLVSLWINWFAERSVSIVLTVLTVDEFEMVKMGARDVSTHSSNRAEAAFRKDSLQWPRLLLA